MTCETWNICVQAIRSLRDAPPWLAQQSLLPFEETVRLPALDAALEGQDVVPNVELNLVKPDYLDFLRGQIKLEPRDREWTRIIEQRLAVLEPFVNKNLIVAMLFRKPESATLRIDPQTRALLHLEIL